MRENLRESTGTPKRSSRRVAYSDRYGSQKLPVELLFKSVSLSLLKLGFLGLIVRCLFRYIPSRSGTDIHANFTLLNENRISDATVSEEPRSKSSGMATFRTLPARETP